MAAKALFLLAGTLFAAQEIEQPALRITVSLVQVDAVVTGKDGKHVADLKRDDFRLFVDGKPRKISFFNYIPGSIPPALGRARGGAYKVAPPALQAGPPSGGAAQRTVALVVDDLGMSFSSAHIVRENLREFVDRQMQPGDLVAILRTGVGVGALQQFTADKRMLHAAIDRIRWNIRSRTGPFTFAPVNDAAAMTQMGQDEHSADFSRDAGQELYAMQRQIYSVGTLGALSYVIRGLADIPGRKAVILFSDGLKVYYSAAEMMNRRERSQDTTELLRQLRSLTDQANRAGVVIYAVDSRGLAYPGVQAADKTSNPAAIEASRREAFVETWDGMKYLTQHTGGVFYRNTNDLAGSAAAAVADVSGYYLLGYNPDESTFKREEGHSRYHQLKVEVNRPGLIVRTRSGYYGIPDSVRQPAPKTPEQQLVEAITSPFDTGALNLRLTSVFSNDAKLGSFLLSMLHVEAKDLTFTEDADGSRHGKLQILSLTYGDDRKPEDSRSAVQQIDLTKEEYEKSLKWGFVYTIQHQIRKPGAYQVRAAIRDAGSGKVGSASQFVQVPDVAKGGMALSGIMLQTGAGASVAGGKTELIHPMAGPAMRIFRPGEPFYYAFLVINPSLDPETSKPDVEIRARVFHDGKPIWSSQPFSLAGTHPEDPHRLRVAQKLVFGPKTPAGEYFIEVSATGKHAARRPPLVQWIDFELQPALN